MPRVQIGDIGIHYEIHGEGEPILLIAGFTNSAGGWFMQLPALSKEYRVIAFDNRGTGQSDKLDIPYTMDEMADDAVGLLDALGIDAAHICGVSMGGRIAQCIAIRHPQKVISLVLACTGCGGPHDIAGDAEALKSLAPPRQAQQRAPDEEEPGPWSNMMSHQFVENNPDIMAQIMAVSLESPAPPSTFKNHGRASRSHDSYDRLPEIKTPTLIMSGDADVIVPVENSRLLADKIPNSELVVFEGMGHCFKWEAAEAFNRTTLDFLGRHPRSA
ncbi:MAG: alpha/beta fold hydrolase [Desulfobacterales bacterium]